MSEKNGSNVAENFRTQKSEQYYVDIVSGLAERTIKRLWIVIILLIVLLVGTNVAWLVYESSFEEIVTKWIIVNLTKLMTSCAKSLKSKWTKSWLQVHLAPCTS